MKNLLLAMFAFGVILMSGCKKDETTTDTGGGGGPLVSGQCKISCKISGGATSNFTSDISMSAANRIDDVITMSGSVGKGTTAEYIMMFLPTNIAVGTYISTTTSVEFTITYTKGENGWVNDSEEALTLVVTKVTKNSIEGTFSGKLIGYDNLNDVTVTEGKFEAKY